MPPPPEPLNPSAPLRVLVADDSREAAELTAELLQLSLPCEVVTAFDGVEALRRAESWRPDAIVLDLHMPGLDGIEVARRVRQRLAGRVPYLIALTGQPGTESNLAAIDHQFDRVFAKPLDIDQLVASLAWLASGAGGTTQPAVPFNLAELFTRAARQVVPVARQLSFSFDYCGPGVIVHGQPIDVQCGVHRLLLGAVDLLAAGFVIFSADATLDASGRCDVVVEAAGTGPLRPPGEVDAVLERLHLVDGPAAIDGRRAVRTASGICPNTGVAVSFSSEVHEGFLLRMVLRYTEAEDDGGSQSAVAPGAHAWLVDHDEVPSAWLNRRLQRLGWRVTRFASCADALQHLRRDGAPAAGPAPSLLVAIESPEVSASQAEALQRALPRTHCIFAVMAGSSRLGSLDAPAGCELRVYPFSPMELADFCALVAPASAVRSGTTVPGSLGPDDRPLVLLVDDNEINRIVGRGLIEALGYEVATAKDGLDAIDHCRQAPPRLVLMDLDMPVLKGIAATLRLRELQRNGEVAPFPIVAATADATADAQTACERAGMDGYLTKPLRLAELRAELRRFMPLH